MFELPNAKRVCRDDLKSSHSSRASSPVQSSAAIHAAAALEKAFASFETFTAPSDKAVTNLSADLEHTKDEDEEQEFEFRLFHSATPRDTAEKIKDTNQPNEHEPLSRDNGVGGGEVSGVQKLKIRIRSPSPSKPSGDGAFIVPFRGWEYYFSDPELVIKALEGIAAKNGQDNLESNLSKKANYRLLLNERFRDVALTGDEVLANSTSGTWPGCRLPWRVMHLPGPGVKGKPTTKPTLKSQPGNPKSRKKPGKKRRIILRKRLETKKAAEDADQEKRTRKNRERKLKRRQKEREMKAAARANADGVPGDQDKGQVE